MVVKPNIVLTRYLPPYTLFMPFARENDKKDGEYDSKNEKKVKKNGVYVSQLAFLVICVLLISITESKKIRRDPLNFSILNITLEVIRYYFSRCMKHAAYVQKKM